MKKPGIPSVKIAENPELERSIRAAKETLEILTGARGGKIARLPADAGLAAIVAKVNEILDRLQ
jgi:hypothetical protein